MASARSASHAVDGSPSIAANGRRSGNWAKPGEKSARTEATPPPTSATVCASVPRRGNGSSCAESSESFSPAGTVQPVLPRRRAATKTRRRFESLMTNEAPRAAWARSAGSVRSAA